MSQISNPFRPGAGHMPPYLAGRTKEKQEFGKLLEQDIIIENLVLTGLRGSGKTVLLETFKPQAQQKGWLWVGTDLSESASLNEDNISTRLITDLAVITSSIIIDRTETQSIGFTGESEVSEQTLNFHTLANIYQKTPGLSSDKLKNVLELVWASISSYKPKGIIFAYDEAQNLTDHTEKDQFPLSLLLDVFQSIQRKGIPFFLLLTGLPPLFPKLVDARTYAERMFHVVFLDKLVVDDCKDAILKPIENEKCPVKFTQESVDLITEISGGYPYFIQFICREVFDVFIQRINEEENPTAPIDDIIYKLDTDFFAGRWARATDRQRELMSLIAQLNNCDTEYTVQEIVDISKQSAGKPFSNSHVNQMLSTLTNNGLIYKNRHGKYSFAVPLLGQFIRRQAALNTEA